MRRAARTAGTAIRCAPQGCRCRCRALRSGSSKPGIVGPTSFRSIDTSPLPREFDRVAAEIEQHLAQPPGSPITQSGSSGSMFVISSSPLACAWIGEQMRDVVDGVAQIHVDPLQIELAGFDLREIEDVVDDGEQARRRCRGWSRCDRAASGQGWSPAAAPSCRSRRSSACEFRGSCWRGTATSPAPRARHAPSPDSSSAFGRLQVAGSQRDLLRRARRRGRRRCPTRSRYRAPRRQDDAEHAAGAETTASDRSAASA